MALMKVEVAFVNPFEIFIFGRFLFGHLLPCFAKLREHGEDSWPLFRSVTQQGDVIDHPIRGEDVRRIIRRRAQLAGIDTAKVSAHSIRSGFVTEAARQGVAMLDTMALTTHRNVETLRRYYRPAELSANPAARL